LGCNKCLTHNSNLKNVLIMKIHSFFAWFLTAVLMASFAPSTSAQDDLYYDPSTDRPVLIETTTTTTTTTNAYEVPTESNPVAYDDESYDYEDEYDYQYSSRIRRFHRNVNVVEYYDPFYTDIYFYDPFFSPGTSIYVTNYNDYSFFNRHRRRAYWNDWGWGNSYYGGYNSWCLWNRPSYAWGNNGWGFNGGWGNTYVFNNYYYDPYWTINGYNPYHCQSNSWNSNQYYYNNNNNYYNHNNDNGHKPSTYTGVRRGGTTVNPGYVRIDDGKGRLASSDKSPGGVVELRGQKNGRKIVSDNEPAAVDRNGNTRGNTTSPAPRPETGRTPRTESVEKSTDTRAPRTERTEPVRPSRTETEPSRPTKTEPVRPSRQESEPVRTETRPSRRTETEPVRPSRQESEPTRTETRPSRRQESEPTRSKEETRPSRRQETTTEPRPSRRNNETSSESRPSRSESRSESRPSRTESSPSRSETRSNESGSSRSSGSSNSGSSGSSRSSSGGGKRGRD
jgi:uncharacterized membrane protein YgcG